MVLFQLNLETISLWVKVGFLCPEPSLDNGITLVKFLCNLGNLIFGWMLSQSELNRTL